MDRLLEILRFRPLAATLIVLAVIATYQIWGAVEGTRKLMADELPSEGSRAAYEVVLRFPPEAFHTTRLQDIGRVISVDRRSVFLTDVTAAAVQKMATNYWVADIRRWQGP